MCFPCKEGLTKRSLGNTYYFSLKACFESSLAFSSHLYLGIIVYRMPLIAVTQLQK